MKTVKFLKDETVNRVEEGKPFTYKAGEEYELRDDRANLRIENGTAVEVKKGKVDGNAVDGTKTVAGTDGSDTSKRAVDEPVGGGKGKGK